MIKTHLLTESGFQFLEDYLSDYPMLKRNSSYTFYGHHLELATGLQLVYPKGFNLMGLFSDYSFIDNSMVSEEISKYKSQDYIYTPFICQTVFPEVLNIYTEYVHLKEEGFSQALLSIKEASRSVIDFSTKMQNISLDKNFYKFIGISLIRGQVYSTEKLNLVSYKFSKNKPLHLSMKKDLLDFFNSNGLHYEISEYNKYYYVNFLDKTLSSIVKSIFDENIQNSGFKKLFLNSNSRFFIEYLYSISNNNYHLNINTFLFLKEIAYNGGLVLTLKENTGSSEKKYSFVSELNSAIDSLDAPVIYLEHGYLTKILSNRAINIKDVSLNSIHLPNHLIIC